MNYLERLRELDARTADALNTLTAVLQQREAHEALRHRLPPQSAATAGAAQEPAGESAVVAHPRQAMLDGQRTLEGKLEAYRAAREVLNTAQRVTQPLERRFQSMEMIAWVREACAQMDAIAASASQIREPDEATLQRLGTELLAVEAEHHRHTQAATAKAQQWAERHARLQHEQRTLEAELMLALGNWKAAVHLAASLTALAMGGAVLLIGYQLLAHVGTFALATATLCGAAGGLVAHRQQRSLVEAAQETWAQKVREFERVQPEAQQLDFLPELPPPEPIPLRAQ